VLLGNGDATFQAAISYGAGGTPTRNATSILTTGDFNKDNKLDLVVANSGGASVLLGNGDGTFQPPVSYATEANPESVATGDFNADGKLDLAVAGGDGISVLLGNGNGTFQSAVNYSTGVYPASVATGDFNGDGKADLAVAIAPTSSSAYNVSVLLGNGNGTFQTAVHYDVVTYPYSVTVGDFTGDEKTDLAVATDVGITILAGKGDGTFQSALNYGAGNHPTFAGAGDFNKDGRVDLVVADTASGNVCVLLAEAGGFLQAAANYSAGWVPLSMQSADFNGDGKADLAVVNYSSSSGGNGSVTMLLGAGDGSFTTIPTSNTLGSLSFSGAVGDFNGDGKPDL
ncbi:MAG TPA: VCBS repeat-containing protein, partial [Candidatus Binatia bacterium]|nr:VCBS repeat-containing protein [Candidatus Binatia bacterium]